MREGGTEGQREGRREGRRDGGTDGRRGGGTEGRRGGMLLSAVDASSPLTHQPAVSLEYGVDHLDPLRRA